MGLLNNSKLKVKKKTTATTKKHNADLLRRHDSSKADCPSDPRHAPSEWSYSAHMHVFHCYDLCSLY